MLADTLLMIRASALALAAQVEWALSVLGTDGPDLAGPVAAAAAPACQHPERDRVPAPRMGGPAASVCRACGEEVL